MIDDARRFAGCLPIASPLLGVLLFLCSPRQLLWRTGTPFFAGGEHFAVAAVHHLLTRMIPFTALITGTVGVAGYYPDHWWKPRFTPFFARLADPPRVKWTADDERGESACHGRLARTDHQRLLPEACPVSLRAITVTALATLVSHTAMKVWWRRYSAIHDPLRLSALPDRRMIVTVVLLLISGADSAKPLATGWWCIFRASKYALDLQT